uniref:MARVEL domain-containing protein n=1 Tax=Poecilia formosa TaxID=48698 RepID=A0A087YS93_POEFO
IPPGAAMVYMNLKSITQPVGILRILAVIFTCISFSLAASVTPDSSPYWGWCIFTWVFCCFFTLLILILEFTTISTKVPFAWEDFTGAFAILSSVMCLFAAIMYPTFFACNTCYRQIGASVVSWVCIAVYVAEVVLTRLRPTGQDSGFLSTPPGIMKMLESFFACLIFLSLENDHYSGHQYATGLNWCIAVYSLCFILAITIILLTLGNITAYVPFPFDKVVIVCNVLAAVMYLTAMVMWPLYSFHNNKRPATCGRLCPWDKLVLITVMTIFNSIVYVLDSIYSILLVFFLRN